MRNTVRVRIGSEVIVEGMVLLNYEYEVLNLGWPRRIDRSQDDWQAEANRQHNDECTTGGDFNSVHRPYDTEKGELH
jgi:hypothetical protein